MQKIKISNQELLILLDSEPEVFPKYVTQLINLANQNAGGTRPKVVGQLSELIQECPNDSMAEWQSWYLERHPTAIQDATDKIYQMVSNLKDAMTKIDKPMVERWVRDLVLVKTFVGLRFQSAILKKVAEANGEDYTLSTPEEEALGIDGYIGTKPVSIKPESYKLMPRLPESISVTFIYYAKLKDGIRLEYDI